MKHCAFSKLLSWHRFLGHSWRNPTIFVQTQGEALGKTTTHISRINLNTYMAQFTISHLSIVCIQTLSNMYTSTTKQSIWIPAYIYIYVCVCYKSYIYIIIYIYVCVYRLLCHLRGTKQYVSSLLLRFSLSQVCLCHVKAVAFGDPCRYMQINWTG